MVCHYFSKIVNMNNIFFCHKYLVIISYQNKRVQSTQHSSILEHFPTVNLLFFHILFLILQKMPAATAIDFFNQILPLTVDTRQSNIFTDSCGFPFKVILISMIEPSMPMRDIFLITLLLIMSTLCGSEFSFCFMFHI